MPLRTESTETARHRIGGLAPPDRMPPAVRVTVFAGLLALLAGAGAIVAVRGPAILIDLAAAASRWLCL